MVVGQWRYEGGIGNFHKKRRVCEEEKTEGGIYGFLEEFDVLMHDGDSLCKNSAKVGIFNQTNKIGFNGFLKSRNGTALESKIYFEILSDFSNQSLERKFPD